MTALPINHGVYRTEETKINIYATFASFIGDHDFLRPSSNRNQLGRDSRSSGVYPWSAYRDLSKFFTAPHVRLTIAKVDRDAWKEEHQVVRKFGVSQRESSKARFLSVSVVNDGRGVAQGCVAVASFYRPEKWWTRLRDSLEGLAPERASALLWGESPREVEVFGLPGPITGYFKRETDIFPNTGAVLSVLFVLEGHDKAYLTTEREMSLSVPSSVDIVVTVAGSNFVAKRFGRYRIILRSWNDMNMFHVTLLTRISDIFRRWMRRPCKNSVDEPHSK